MLAFILGTIAVLPVFANLVLVDIRKFWIARGLNFPSPADWAQNNGSSDPDVLKAQIEKLEAEFKKPIGAP